MIDSAVVDTDVSVPLLGLSGLASALSLKVTPETADAERRGGGGGEEKPGSSSKMLTFKPKEEKDDDDDE